MASSERKLDRTQTRKGRLGDPDDGGYVPGTMQERVAMVWPLTVEACSLSGRYDVERRLQRHITRLKRREG